MTPDLLDLIAAWNIAQAALTKCLQTCGAQDPGYFCALPLAEEKKARANFHRELRSEIAARLASL